jgi:ABC-type transport system involved in multi-copper enzyme maturation permease subunit
VIGRVVALALNTFREAVRNRVLYVLLVFALLLILSTLVFGQLSVHEEVRVTRDLGLGGISIFGVLIAVFVGVNLVYKELDKKTVFSILPKPIRRFEFVVGKFLGMALTLAIQVAIMALVLVLVIAVQGGEVGPMVFRAVALTYLEVLVVTSIAILFSSFSSPLLSGLFTLLVFLIGRSVPELRALVGKLPDGVGHTLGSVALRIAPDLHLFYVSGSMVDGRYVSVHGDFIAWGYVALAAAYAVGYVVCAVTLASIFFSRRDFV